MACYATARATHGRRAPLATTRQRVRRTGRTGSATAAATGRTGSATAARDRLAVRTAGKVDRAGDEVHVKGRPGLVRIADLGGEVPREHVVPGARQIDGPADVEERAHQVARAKLKPSALVTEVHVEYGVQRSCHRLARRRLEAARPRLCARRELGLVLAAEHRPDQVVQVRRARGERQHALLHRGHRRSSRNKLWQQRFEPGLELCGPRRPRGRPRAETAAKKGRSAARARRTSCGAR